MTEPPDRKSGSEAGAAPDFRYPPSARLRTAGDFRAALQRSSGEVRGVFNGSWLRCFWRANGGQPRFGLVVGKKQAPRAVDRNRIKRCLRDQFRLRRHQFPAVDVVFQLVGRYRDHNAAIRAGYDRLLREEAQAHFDRVIRVAGRKLR